MSFFYVPSSMIGQCGGKADERCVEIRKRELVLSLRRGSRILRGRLKRMHRLIILGGQRLIRYIGRLVSLSLNCEPRGRGVATIVFQSTRDSVRLAVKLTLARHFRNATAGFANSCLIRAI